MLKSENCVGIVGAGLAGLRCALTLQDSGVPFRIYEASDGPGGRVRTDDHRGYRLDRGFQVLLTAYPEAREVLDYKALDLRPFYPGAMVRWNGKFHRVADPWRRPVDGLAGLVNPVGTFLDKLKVSDLRSAARAGALDDLWARPEVSTLTRLRELGFSDAMVDRFFRPFLGGIFLEKNLDTSSRMLEFVFRMFSEGDTAVPAKGMGEISMQLASRLPDDCVESSCSVDKVKGRRIHFSNGEDVDFRAVVLAVDGPSRSKILGEADVWGSRAVTCLYFGCENSPSNEPVLYLNGDSTGPVHNLAVMSAVSRDYAPAGKHLISVTVLGLPHESTLESTVRTQLTEWFGRDVNTWEFLRSYRIAHAQPDLTQVEVKSRTVQLNARLFACGDYLETASIQGALTAGRRAGTAVLDAMRLDNRELQDT